MATHEADVTHHREGIGVQHQRGTQGRHRPGAPVAAVDVTDAANVLHASGYSRQQQTPEGAGKRRVEPDQQHAARGHGRGWRTIAAAHQATAQPAEQPGQAIDERAAGHPGAECNVREAGRSGIEAVADEPGRHHHRQYHEGQHAGLACVERPCPVCGTAEVEPDEQHAQGERGDTAAKQRRQIGMHTIPIGQPADAPHQQSRQQQQGAQRQQQQAQVEVEVAQIGGHCSQGVGGQKTCARCEVVAVAAQKPYGRVFCTARVQLFFGVLDATGALAMDQGRQPAADVPAAGHAGKVVELPQQFDFGERLDDTEIEGGAANAAAGEGESGQRALGPCGLAVGLADGCALLRQDATPVE